MITKNDAAQIVEDFIQKDSQLTPELVDGAVLKLDKKIRNYSSKGYRTIDLDDFCYRHIKSDSIYLRRALIAELSNRLRTNGFQVDAESLVVSW